MKTGKVVLLAAVLSCSWPAMTLASFASRSMAVSRSLQAVLPDLYSASLIPIHIDKDNSVSEEKETTTVQQVAIAQASSTDVSLAFVVRRPGWVLCREHGQQLSELVASFHKDTVSLWGIVKETNVDDAGLADFYHDYFTFSLYRDVNLQVYKSLGNRKLSLHTWNPWKLWRGYRELSKRLNKKGLSGNLKGEGIVQGGVLVFDKQGILRFAYQEETGSELQMDEVQEAIDALRKEQQQANKEL